MGESDTKKSDVGYKTDIPDDILNEALESVEKPAEKKAEADASQDEGVEASGDEGIEIEVGEADDSDVEASDDVPTDEIDANVDMDVDAEAASAESADEDVPELTADELLEQGLVQPQIVERLEAESERARAAQERMLRALAETENIRRRLERQKEEALRFANQDLIKQLLPVLDNLILCLENADANSAQLREGVEMTLRQWYKVFEKLGVEQVPAEPGTPFDPSVHEAVMQDANSELPSHQVSKVLQVGFTYHERLLRPAMVAVSTGAKAEAAAEPAPEAEPASTEATEAAESAETEQSAEAPEGTTEPAETAQPAESAPADDAAPAKRNSVEQTEASEAEKSPESEEKSASAAAAPVADDPEATQNKERDPESDNPLFDSDDVDDWAETVDSAQSEEPS